MELTLNKYQKRAMTTCMASSNNPLYMLFMLGEEVGELQGKFSKAIRKGHLFFDCNDIHSQHDSIEAYREWVDLVKKEMGDVLWGIAGLAHVLNIPLQEIGDINLDKLAARKAAGTIDGNGDGIERSK